ncbi:MAG: c-type cytochrome biogenesis protein CcsB [Myxococcota bacterium]
MTNLEALFVALASLSYFLSTALWLYVIIFRVLLNKERAEETSPALWMIRIVVLGFAFHTAAIAVRWATSGHPPVMGLYENAILGSWFIIILYLLGLKKFASNFILTGGAVIPFSLLLIGWGLLERPRLAPLSPPFQSNWLWIHVGFAWLAFGSYIISAALGIAYLIKERIAGSATSEQGGEDSSRGYLSSPDIKKLDELILAFVAFGFVSQGFMIASGAIWAADLWGSYWSWDPVETWSLIAWLVYAVFLHFRLVVGWRGRKCAILTIISLVAIIIAFFGVGAINTMHTMILGAGE